MDRRGIVGLLLVGGMSLAPTAVWAQRATTGGIAGTVTDTTGGVLPGVTVEASSPASLQTRSVTSDSEGLFRILGLPPGSYSVSFTLPGFGTFVRDGIDLSTGVTAQVDGEMRVGALEETVTVTGLAPVVDVQNVITQNILSREVLDVLPTGKTVQGFAALTVGASLQGVGGNMHDVGGNRGEQFGSILIHGSHQLDGRLTMDGMRYNNTFNNGGGQARTYFPNQNAVQEVVIETTGVPAEQETGGVVQNSVLRDGGNLWTGNFVGGGTNESLQNSNLSPYLKDLGLQESSKVKKIWDWGGGVGGPILRDRLWFYYAQRDWGTQEFNAGQFYNKSPRNAAGQIVAYVPDLDMQGFSNIYNHDNSARLNWQAAQNHRISISHSVQKNCYCNFGSTGSPSRQSQWHFSPTYLAIGTWTYTASDRLLFEAGVASLKSVMSPQLSPAPAHGNGVLDTDLRINDLGTGFLFGGGSPSVSWASLTLNRKGNDFSQHNERFSVSYITGTHAVKAGVQTLFGVDDYPFVGNPKTPFVVSLFNGVPVSLRQWAAPGGASHRMSNIGMFVQDQWTIDRVTLNMGVRVDRFIGHLPAQTRPGGLVVPELFTPETRNIVDLKDYTPRLGVAWDVFGDGRTAVKVSAGKYVAALAAEFMRPINPAESLVTNAYRDWVDANQNFFPDCDLSNNAANGECGSQDNNLFGTVNQTRRYSDEVVQGWGNREYGWQTAFSVQHELRDGFGVTAGYFRTWYGNFSVIDNTFLTSADYDPFCVTAPVDSRLPGGGGYEICNGLGDIKPALRGKVNQVVRLWQTSSERGQGNSFSSPAEVYNGVDLTFNARFGDGGLLQGGTNFGRVTRNCPGGIIPNNLPIFSAEAPVQHCATRPPFFQPQWKLAGIYPLPYDFDISATFQHLPGIGIGERRQQGSRFVSRSYTSAEIKPSLGRDLASGPNGRYTVHLFEQDKYFEPRLIQLDVRLTKVLRLGRARTRLSADIYNLFNDDAILAMQTTFGSQYRRPQQVMNGRLFKFGVQFDL